MGKTAKPKPKPEAETDAATDAEPESEAKAFLKSARDLAFVFAILLYYMGWVYIYYYLDRFGLSIKAVDIDIYNLIIYSSNVFVFIFQKYMVALIAIALGVILVIFWKKANTAFAKLFPVFVVLIFPLIFFVAKRAGNFTAQEILDDPSSLKKIVFVFKEIKKPTPLKKGEAGDPMEAANDGERRVLLNQNNNQMFRLLVANKEEYFVLLYGQHYRSKYPQIRVIKKELIESSLIITE